MVDCRDLEVTLPPALAAFGGSVKIRMVGPAGGRLFIALGGISGNHLVALGEDGGDGWWPGLVGQGGALDPHRDRILGVDFIADPTGDTAPSTRDQAQAICAALDAVGAARADAIVGASYGGMVALSLAEHFPDCVDRLVVISAGAEPHPAATAMRELQRRVVALGLKAGLGAEALAIARGLAMMTYRTPEEFAQRFQGGIAGPGTMTATEPGAYLRARGEAFVGVMSPQRFLSLSASIDRHFVRPAVIRQHCLLIGADSDQLVPAEQMRALAACLAGPAELHLRNCVQGHDMFLTQAAALSHLIQPFLERA